MLAPPRRQKSADAVAGLQHRQRDRRRTTPIEGSVLLDALLFQHGRPEEEHERGQFRTQPPGALRCRLGASGRRLALLPALRACGDELASHRQQWTPAGRTREAAGPGHCRAGRNPRCAALVRPAVEGRRVRTEAEPGRAKRRNDGRLTPQRTGPAVGRPGAGIAASRILPPHREQHGVAPRSAPVRGRPPCVTRPALGSSGSLRHRGEKLA